MTIDRNKPIRVFLSPRPMLTPDGDALSFTHRNVYDVILEYPVGVKVVEAGITTYARAVQRYNEFKKHLQPIKRKLDPNMIGRSKCVRHRRSAGGARVTTSNSP